jgi:hypothetical protein
MSKRVQWWGVFLFSLSCLILYGQKARDRARKLSELSFRLQELKKEQLLVLQERDHLTQRLQSESDPAWIEMVLMKELGVVPEGWVKIRFVQ